MNKITLTGTDFSTYPLALGTGGFGDPLTEEQSKEQLNEFLNIGGNFIDTAHVYGGEDSKSEKIIGCWFKETGHRHDVFLSTKGCHPRFSSMNISRLSESDISKDLDESLTYLNTDYIDVYFVHRDDPTIPVGEILEVLESKYKDGKILNYGCSNWKLNRIIEAENYAKEHGLRGFSFNQLMWSLADITEENVPDKTLTVMNQELIDYHTKTKMNAMAFTSTAKAYLTRRSRGVRHATSYGVDIELYYDNPSNERLLNRLLELCNDDFSIMDYALAFFSENDFPAIPVAAFSSMKQFAEGTAFIAKEFDKSIIKELASMKKH